VKNDFYNISSVPTNLMRPWSFKWFGYPYHNVEQFSEFGQVSKLLRDRKSLKSFSGKDEKRKFSFFFLFSVSMDSWLRDFWPDGTGPEVSPAFNANKVS